VSETASSAEAPRRISGLLMLGLLVFPPIFAWFLLRRGYAKSTRVAGFTFAAVMFGFGILHASGL